MNYEMNNGLLVPAGKARGIYHAQHFRDGELIDEFEFENVITNQGLAYLLNAGLAGLSAITSWYIGVFQNNYAPVATDTASSIVGNAGEFTGYTGGARPTFTPAQATSTPSITNSASKATFNFNGSATLTGAFLISSATPGSNSGTLYSAAQFGSSKQVANTDSITLTYQTALTSS